MRRRHQKAIVMSATSNHISLEEMRFELEPASTIDSELREAIATLGLPRATKEHHVSVRTKLLRARAAAWWDIWQYKKTGLKTITNKNFRRRLKLLTSLLDQLLKILEPSRLHNSTLDSLVVAKLAGSLDSRPQQSFDDVLFGQGLLIFCKVSESVRMSTEKKSKRSARGDVESTSVSEKLGELELRVGNAVRLWAEAKNKRVKDKRAIDVCESVRVWARFLSADMSTRHRRIEGHFALEVFRQEVARVRDAAQRINVPSAKASTGRKRLAWHDEFMKAVVEVCVANNIPTTIITYHEQGVTRRGGKFLEVAWALQDCLTSEMAARSREALAKRLQRSKPSAGSQKQRTKPVRTLPAN